MRVLVIGGGGREHAIVWKLAQDKRIDQLFCLPGNAGIASMAECVPMSVTDIDGVVKWVKEHDIDLTFVAPDDPLAMGMVDALEAEGLRAFGPRKAAAEIEGSKVFCKNLLAQCGISTPAFAVFEDMAEALAYVETCPVPTVVKADGLALGKGVIIAQTREEAADAIRSMMEDKAFGNAGNRVVVEEFVTGREVSVLVFTDGKTVLPMVSSQDHKKALDGDKGLNTGGMGTFSPSRVYDAALEEKVLSEIIQPTVDAMREMGRTFKGVLYCGIMLTEQGPTVLEYNARFGDPETQVILPRLKSELLDVIDAIIDERLDEITLQWREEAAVCVVLASGGYPEKYQKGYPITGLDTLPEDADNVVFHAGTRLDGGQVVTAGGRVLNVVCLADTIEEARERAYANAERIHFADRYMRTDIAKK